MNYILVAFGTISLVLGVIGIFMPVLPTTPFLLLAASLYLKGSKPLYDRLMANEYLGTYIRNFKENRAIPLRVKVTSVSMVWVTLLYCGMDMGDESSFYCHRYRSDNTYTKVQDLKVMLQSFRATVGLFRRMCQAPRCQCPAQR